MWQHKGIVQNEKYVIFIHPRGIPYLYDFLLWSTNEDNLKNAGN